MRLEQNTREWHVWRRQGIGASDVYPALTRPLAVYLNKVEGVDLFDGDESFAKWGHHVERPIIDFVAETRGWGATEPKCFEHPIKPWLRASLDAVMLRTDEDGFISVSHLALEGQGLADVVLGPVDAKNRSYGWDDFGDDGDIAEAGTCPPDIRVQVMHQCFVAGAALGLRFERGFCAVSVGGQPPILLTVPYDASWYVETVVPQLDELWGRVCDRSPPPATGHPDDVRAANRAVSGREPGKVVDLGPWGESVVEQMKAASASAQAAAKPYEQERSRLRAELLMAMGDAELALCGKYEVPVQVRGSGAFLVEGMPSPRWAELAAKEIDEALRVQRGCKSKATNTPVSVSLGRARKRKHP